MFRKNNLENALSNARKNGKAIGQFNLSSLEQLKGVALAAKTTGTPVICGTSPGEANYFSFQEIVAVVRAIEKREGVSIFLNYDHGKDVEKIKEAVDSGYDMVHFDGSDLELEENINKTKEVVKYARKRNVLVEGEVSKILGRSIYSDEEIENVTLTSIEKVVKFVKETGVNCIAFDVGSFHGVHKNEPVIYPERVTQLLENANPYVVLHGGSGVSNKVIRELIERGVVKINVNTEIRFQWRNTLYNTLAENEKEIVPYKILPAVVEAISYTVKEKINLFNYEKNNS